MVERLHRALNAHDIDAFMACFDPSYESEQPAHPDRAFGGIDQVRTNWSSMFESLPNFAATLRTISEDGDRVWSEWHWTATRLDGSAFDWRGAILMGIRGDRIAWARLYMEPTEVAGEGIDAAVREMTSPSGNDQ